MVNYKYLNDDLRHGSNLFKIIQKFVDIKEMSDRKYYMIDQREGLQ